jgi:multiple sugar transport system ATP-binding protein
MSATVEVVEPMGAEKYVYLSSAGNSVVARVSPDNKAYVSQIIDLVVNMENVKFFDAETDAVIG